MAYLAHTGSRSHDSHGAEIDSDHPYATLYTEHDPDLLYPGRMQEPVAWLLSASVEVGKSEVTLSADLSENTDHEGVVRVTLRCDPETGEVVVRVNGNGNRVEVVNSAPDVVGVDEDAEVCAGKTFPEPPIR